MEKCQNTQQNKSYSSLLRRIHKHHSGAGTFYTSSAGTIVALILLFLFYLSGINVHDTYATASTLSLSMDNTTAGLDISSVSNDGTFTKSSVSTITVSTNNSTGYTLSIAASSSTNYDKLMLQDQSAYIGSIESRTTENDFSSSSQNNVWGYIPSKYDSVDNTSTKYYYPAPNTNGDILANTNCANGVSDCPNEDTYTIGFGVRVDSSTKIGTYYNTYLVQIVAEPVTYSIAYKDNIVSNMPVDDTGTTDSTSINISNSTPVRDGYTFIGWCPGTVTINANGTDTCSTTTIVAGGAVSISQTGGSNAYTLRAMWKDNYHISNVTTMQEFSTMMPDKKSKIIASMNTDQQYQLTDTRDNKVYWVAKLRDGKVWMTQGLDLDLANGTVLEHTKSDIGWTENKVAKTWNPATSANTINFEGGTGTTISGWTNSNDVPYSASPYYATKGTDLYILSSNSNANDTTTNLSGCTNSGKTSIECSHYKVGNYYNFAAATATNSVNGTVGHTTTNTDNYTVMPDSICPAGWRLPHGLLEAATNNVASPNNSEFDTLLYAYGITSYTGVAQGISVNYDANGLNKIRATPLHFVRSGIISGNAINHMAEYIAIWSNTIGGQYRGYSLVSWVYNLYPAGSDDRPNGFAVRCVLR